MLPFNKGFAAALIIVMIVIAAVGMDATIRNTAPAPDAGDTHDMAAPHRHVDGNLEAAYASAGTSSFRSTLTTNVSDSEWAALSFSLSAVSRVGQSLPRSESRLCPLPLRI